LTWHLRGATFDDVSRRGKYLLFSLRKPGGAKSALLGHLGMTGRMYLLAKPAALPKHAAVTLDLGEKTFVFEDTRYFGRFTLDTGLIESLGKEPMSEDFTPALLAQGLARSAQPVKVKLLDQSVVAGMGNLYASEVLFRAGISPLVSAKRLRDAQVARLWRAIRDVLAEAIERGSTVPLNYDGTSPRDGLFYFGRGADATDSYEERLQVYDRAGKPCLFCGTSIRRVVQAARSTFYCPNCQRKSLDVKRGSISKHKRSSVGQNPFDGE
jgi:formamidopyrimidine-DNA glycosylase